MTTDADRIARVGTVRVDTVDAGTAPTTPSPRRPDAPALHRLLARCRGDAARSPAARA